MASTETVSHWTARARGSPEPRPLCQSNQDCHRIHCFNGDCFALDCTCGGQSGANAPQANLTKIAMAPMISSVRVCRIRSDGSMHILVLFRSSNGARNGIGKMDMYFLVIEPVQRAARSTVPDLPGCRRPHLRSSLSAEVVDDPPTRGSTIRDGAARNFDAKIAETAASAFPDIHRRSKKRLSR